MGRNQNNVSAYAEYLQCTSIFNRRQFRSAHTEADKTNHSDRHNRQSTLAKTIQAGKTSVVPISGSMEVYSTAVTAVTKRCRRRRKRNRRLCLGHPIN
jgi:hypothetical protein